jgi:hypothetical protein
MGVRKVEQRDEQGRKSVRRLGPEMNFSNESIVPQSCSRVLWRVSVRLLSCEEGARHYEGGRWSHLSPISSDKAQGQGKRGALPPLPPSIFPPARSSPK